MTTALVAEPRGITGNRDEIEATRQRILSMIPGSNGVPREIVFATAQLSVSLGLNPIAGELYIANMGSTNNPNYTPIVGIAGYRTLARRQSEFIVKMRELSPEETKHRRGDLYHENDVAVECKLWNLKVAGQCKSLGIEYEPTVAHGYYREHARAKYKWVNNRKTDEVLEWQSDNIPETWTRSEVAEKRAEKNAIKKAYDMTRAEQQARESGAEVNADEATYKVIDDIADDLNKSTAPIAERNEVYEDGDLLFASDKSTKRDVVVDYEVVEDDGMADLEEPTKEKQINTLGQKALGDAWADKSAEMLEKASAGSAESWSEVSEAKQDKMIGWLEKQAAKVA